MTHYFDDAGWLTDKENPDRSTDVQPPKVELSVGFEWNFTGYTWVQMERNPKAQDPPPTQPRFISVPGFFDRFGQLKWPILTSPDASVKALVTDCLARVKTGINLNTQDVANGLALLQSKGFSVDAKTIINAPLKESEKP